MFLTIVVSTQHDNRNSSFPTAVALCHRTSIYRQVVHGLRKKNFFFVRFNEICLPSPTHDIFGVEVVFLEFWKVGRFIKST